jgi:hypothetical protein
MVMCEILHQASPRQDLGTGGVSSARRRQLGPAASARPGDVSSARRRQLGERVEVERRVLGDH